MTRCACCGILLVGSASLCAHHEAHAPGGDWALANRLMCDLLHRGIGRAHANAVERDRPVRPEAGVYAGSRTAASAAA